MFDNKDENLRILKGAYKKLKSYYYYNKNFIVLREKIALFESDRNVMEETFVSLSNLLYCPNEKDSIIYFDVLLSNIDFFVLPKKFESNKISTSHIVTNAVPKDKKLRTVNFFIDMPIELHILDVVWTLYLGKMSYDKEKLQSCVYGNTLSDYLLYQKGVPDNPSAINFESNRLFNIYFYKYCSWRNNAFASLEENYAKRSDSLLFSLDIQSYYYAVKFRFDFSILLDNHPILDKLSSLTNFMEKVYAKYYELIKPYRLDLNSNDTDEFPLPIGLFSSMVIANLYLNEFDKLVLSNAKCTYYGRYVDDLLLCFKVNGISQENESQEIIHRILVEYNVPIKLDTELPRDNVPDRIKQGT